MSLSSIPRELRNTVSRRDAGRCRYCGLAQFGQGAVFHINHVVPRNRGGATVEANLVVQCPCCSLHKSDKLVAVDPVTREEAPLFHPLKDEWDDHFTLRSDGSCVGLTPVGRGTVAALRMNDPIPRTARALQLLLGILP